jgi:hypothetical protein
VDAGEPERGLVANGFVDGAFEHRLDGAPRAAVHAVAELEVADREFGVVDVKVKRVESGLVESVIHGELGVEPLDRIEELSLVGVIKRLAEKEVVVAIPETLLARAKSGSAQVSIWSEPGKNYVAKLRELAPSADPVTRTYQVRTTIALTGRLREDDIITANEASNNLSIFINKGDGTFPATGTAKEAGGNGEVSIAVADANNDGLLDVFTATYNSPYVVIVLLSDGKGGLVAQPPVPSGGHPWQQIVVGDFNGDGNVDTALNLSDAGAMGVLFGDGLGGLGAVQSYPTGSLPFAIDAADIDGDGDLELVSSNYTSATWTIYENQAGVFVNPRTLKSDQSGSCAVLHDRDNDGDLDLTGFDEVRDWMYFFDNVAAATSVTPSSSIMTRSTPSDVTARAVPTMSTIESTAPTSWKVTWSTSFRWTTASASASRRKIRCAMFRASLERSPASSKARMLA